MPGNGVSYVISLESRKFLQELRNARNEAKKAAREIEQNTGAAGEGSRNAAGGLGDMAGAAAKAGRSATDAASKIGELGKVGRDAGNIFKAFNSTVNAFAQAAGGNFVGAAINAANAVKSFTAAMEANPILLVVAALAGLGLALRSAANSWGEYRKRCAEAKQEHEDFVRQLHDMQYGPASDAYVGSHVGGFREIVSEGNEALAAEVLESKRREVDEARAKAEAASRKYQEWASMNPNKEYVYDLPAGGFKFVTGEEGARAAKAERDTAEQAYKMQLDILKGYEQVLASDNAAKAEQEANAKRDAADAAAASAAELERKAKALAEGDESAMRAHLETMRAVVEKQYGSEAEFQGRLNAGTATKAEIAAWREVEDYANHISDAVERAAQTAALEAERAALKVEQAAREAAAAEEKLARSREAALVRSGDSAMLRKMADRVTREADMKFGVWTRDKNATQEEYDMRAEADRLNKEAKQIEDAARNEREARRREELARQKELAAKRKAYRDNQYALAGESNDPELMERYAKAMFANANRRWGTVTTDRYMYMSEEERKQREDARKLFDAAQNLREGGGSSSRPWVEGVVAARGMSIGDVFSSMRGMNGAKIVDPNVDANRQTARNTAEMRKDLSTVCKSLNGPGVR